VVPAGAAGTVTFDFTPALLYRDGLILGAVAVLVLLGLALVGGRRCTGDATDPWTAPRTLLLLGAGLLVASGGLVGLGLLVVVTAAAPLHRLAPTAVVVLAVLGAIAADLADRWPGGLGARSTLSQCLVLAALAAVLAALTQRSVPQGDRRALDEHPHEA
jgi:arabinofuranan 3-O-arabinosyltransferase